MSLHEQAISQIETIAKNHYQLGQTLHNIQEDHLFEEYGYTGTNAFYNYCEDELGYSSANANNHVRFYRKAIEFGISEDELEEIGFHRFLSVCQLLTRENKDEWINKAKTLTVRELRAEVKKAIEVASTLLKNGEADIDMNVDSKTTVNFKFKYLDTDADFIQKALAEADVQYNCDGNYNKALKHILQDYATVFHNKNITLESALNIINDRYGLGITLNQALASKKEGVTVSA